MEEARAQFPKNHQSKRCAMSLVPLVLECYIHLFSRNSTPTRVAAINSVLHRAGGDGPSGCREKKKAGWRDGSVGKDMCFRA